ncbi:SpoIIE family protein phosphatase [Actinoplanes sp. NPDC026623]|uniref:SpoIIE family protein phosphatase n=1 Tax=Actinoplanes sp. NPDC026623 TaxID=3155610 RepID=UPI0033F84038
MSGDVAAAARVAALGRTGLTAAADPAFERFAVLVRDVLRVPVGLVVLVESDRQVFPGACGLGEPWQHRRQAPLSHSFCQHLMDSAAPLVIEDARTDPRVTGSLAITELNVVGYAGMPLTDEAGVVLGSLCAIDTVPRRWTRGELTLLADLAAACSDSLRLRIVTSGARQCEVESRALTTVSDAAFDRSQLLLRASVALVNTRTADDVVAAVRDLVTGTLNPAYVGVSLLDRGGMLRLQSSLALPAHVARRWEHYVGAATTPSALAVRDGATVLLPDLTSVRTSAPDAVDTFLEMGWQSAASVPLPGLGGPVGALTFVWKRPYTLDDAEQTVLAALAGYVAQALQRADHLVSQENAAAVLQRALLSDLPDVAPFEVAARYEPASHSEQVGGDWYDAVRLDAERLALIIGDVTGHDIRAAALMGRLRSKLRLLLVDRHEAPAALLRRLEAANRALGDQITATAVLAYLTPNSDGHGHQLHWANAGHPSPLLIDRAGTTVLTGRDPLLGAPRHLPRASHTRHLPPASTVLLYTDGLIETRTQPFDERERQLHAVAADLHGLPLPDLLDQLYTTFAGDDHEDDIALLAVRTPP